MWELGYLVYFSIPQPASAPCILSVLRKVGQAIAELLFRSTIQGFWTWHQSSFASKHTRLHNTMTSSLFWTHRKWRISSECIGGIGNRVSHHRYIGKKRPLGRHVLIQLRVVMFTHQLSHWRWRIEEDSWWSPRRPSSTWITCSVEGLNALVGSSLPHHLTPKPKLLIEGAMWPLKYLKVKWPDKAVSHHIDQAGCGFIFSKVSLAPLGSQWQYSLMLHWFLGLLPLVNFSHQ